MFLVAGGPMEQHHYQPLRAENAFRGAAGMRYTLILLASTFPGRSRLPQAKFKLIAHLVKIARLLVPPPGRHVDLLVVLMERFGEMANLPIDFRV